MLWYLENLLAVKVSDMTLGSGDTTFRILAIVGNAREHSGSVPS